MPGAKQLSLQRLIDSLAATARGRRGLSSMLTFERFFWHLLAYQTFDFGMVPPQGSTARRVDWSSTPNELAKSFSKANRTCQADLPFPQEVSSTPVGQKRIDERRPNACIGLASGPIIQRFLAHMLRNLSFGDLPL